MSELAAYCEDLARRARAAACTLATAPETQKNQWLEKTAAALDSHADEILRANERDLAAAWSSGLSSAQIDRLQLSTDRLQTAATGLREIAALPDPVGRVLDSSVRPNGLRLQKVGVPLGVIFFIYESRPNVTLDAAGLCVKSGNAIILRGGTEALQSNTALVEIIQQGLGEVGLPTDAVQLVADPDRILAAASQPVATADSWVLDHCTAWVNLAREIVRACVPQARLVDLANATADR